MNNAFFHFQRITNGRDSRKIGNNTYAIKVADDCYAIKLHNTHVVTAYLDGRIVLDNGGWYSATTKNRMHEYLPNGVGVRQAKGDWFVTVDQWQSTVPYRNGMTLMQDSTDKVTVR